MSRELHVVRVPLWVTATLLVLVAAGIATLIWFLSGKAVYRPASPARLIDALVRYNRTGAARANLLASLAPAIANAILFLPFGVLAFLVFDRPGRGRGGVYLLTVAVGLTFALGVSAWQELLPTRVTGWQDVLWNGAGTLAGAVLGHLRKRVRIRFES
jgi:glycopeptide antibiotics resistance protein